MNNFGMINDLGTQGNNQVHEEVGVSYNPDNDLNGP
jgi:hypothetical protein